jgi:hypothetical protein
MDKLRYFPGTYTAHLYIAGTDGSGAASSLEWELGSVVFDVPAVEMTGLQEPLLPKPAIDHVFRAEERSAPRLLSAVFAVLVLAPWLLFGTLVNSLI